MLNSFDQGMKLVQCESRPMYNRRKLSSMEQFSERIAEKIHMDQTCGPHQSNALHGLGKETMLSNSEQQHEYPCQRILVLQVALCPKTESAIPHCSD